MRTDFPDVYRHCLDMTAGIVESNVKPEKHIFTSVVFQCLSVFCVSDLELSESEASQQAMSTEINTYLACICDNVKDKSASNQLIGIMVSVVKDLNIKHPIALLRGFTTEHTQQIMEN